MAGINNAVKHTKMTVSILNRY